MTAPPEHGKGIGHKGFPDAGHLAVLHDACLLSKTNQGSGRIEEGDQEEDDDDGPHLRVGDDGAHVGDATPKVGSRLGAMEMMLSGKGMRLVTRPKTAVRTMP